jgi:hypothetical protein
MRDQVSMVDDERTAVHFLRKSSTFLSNVSSCIVSMSNEFSPVVLWLELSQCCKNIIVIVLGVKGGPSESSRIKGNSNGFHAMVTMIFRSWIIYLALSSNVSPGRCRWLGPRVASSREISRLNGKRQLWMVDLARGHHQISPPFCKLFNISIQERNSKGSDATGTSKNVRRTTVSTIEGHRSCDRWTSDESKRFTCQNAVQRQPMSTI